jgi:hypothetical protein
MHRITARFCNLFANLPEAAQAVARKNFELLKDNPSHPSLHFKKVGNLWSARAGLNHRTLAVEDGSDSVSIWIGRHDEYTRMIKDQS